jgi:hypothetical protein
MGYRRERRRSGKGSRGLERVGEGERSEQLKVRTVFSCSHHFLRPSRLTQGVWLGYRLRPEILPSVVDKCFGSARASIKLKAIELALMWVEVEGSAEGVVVRSVLLCSERGTNTNVV